MAITSSFFALGPAQRDGRRYCTETHSDAQGVAAIIEYLAAVGANHAGIMAARAITLSDQLADDEARAKVQIDANPTPFRFQTGAEFLNRLRAYYKQASQSDCAYLATWILNRIEAGDVTDAQLQNVFNLTAGQYATIKSKWTTLRSNYLGMQSAVGE